MIKIKHYLVSITYLAQIPVKDMVCKCISILQSLEYYKSNFFSMNIYIGHLQNRARYIWPCVFCQWVFPTLWKKENILHRNFQLLGIAFPSQRAEEFCKRNFTVRRALTRVLIEYDASLFVLYFCFVLFLLLFCCFFSHTSTVVINKEACRSRFCGYWSCFCLTSNCRSPVSRSYYRMSQQML